MENTLSTLDFGINRCSAIVFWGIPLYKAKIPIALFLYLRDLCRLQLYNFSINLGYNYNSSLVCGIHA